MSDVSTDQALGWLTEQLGALSRLRNSSPRSHEFKQWRQATLTAAQRIWPNDPERSERFRRIPFSAGAKSSERSSREAFEHGCSEARRIIRLWIAEIKHHGIELTESSGVQLDPALEEARAKGRLKEMLGFEIPLPGPMSEPEFESDVHAIPDARDASAHRKRPRRATPAAGSLAPPQHDVPESREVPDVDLEHAEPLTYIEPPAPVILPPVDAAPPPVVVISTEPPLVETPPPVVLQRDPPISMSSAPSRRSPADPLGLSIAEAIERVKVEEVVEEILPQVTVAPVTPEPEPAPGAAAPGVDPVLVAAAQGLAALGTDRELDRLGVPLVDRIHVTAALTALARGLHAGDLSWETVRETMGVVMYYPALARRALPLFHPFLDAAA